MPSPSFAFLTVTDHAFFSGTLATELALSLMQLYHTRRLGLRQSVTFKAMQLQVLPRSSLDTRKSYLLPSQTQMSPPSLTLFQYNVNHFLISICVLSLCGCTQSVISSGNKQKALETMQNQHAIIWHKAQFTVCPATGASTYGVAGLETSIAHLHEPEKYSTKANVFVIPKTGATWAGSPQQIYIVTDQGVLGVSVAPLLGIRFVPSLVTNSQVAKGGLMKFSKHVAANIDYDSTIGHALGKTGGKLMSGATVIELRSIFNKSLFRLFNSSIGTDEWQQLASFGIESGILRMDLSRYEGKITGTVWIRIADRQLIRAVENGVQVFPEQK